MPVFILSTYFPRALACLFVCLPCSHLSIGRYHQHSVDCLDSNMTPLEFFAYTYPNTPTFKRETDEWRAFLGRWAHTMAAVWHNKTEHTYKSPVHYLGFGNTVCRV